MKNFDKIINSFDVKKTLNPKIWDGTKNPESAKIKDKVRLALSKVADEFLDYLGEDIFVEDVILTGSLANLNWSEYSDFDLHIIVDYDQFGKQKELYKELFDLKKQVFNDKHDIKIYGYDVELYVQDEKETHTASGIYSIMEDEWVKVPKKIDYDVDKKLLRDKIECWVDKIDNAIESSKEDKDGKKLKTIKDKIKDYRKIGLEKNGEFSYENLVFKFLRRSGYVEKLFNTQNKLFDKELSIENQNINEVASSTELLGGMTVKIPRDGAHAGQSGWQSSNAWDFMAPVGTPVYSLTNGTLLTFTDYGEKVKRTEGKKLYGQSFTVRSEGAPDVYYTHLYNSSFRKGDSVKCGDLLGYIMEFPGGPPHVHIGVKPPGHIDDLIDKNGNLICKGIDGLSSPVKINVRQKLDRSQFLKTIKSIAEKNKRYQYIKGQKIIYDPDVEVIQTALQYLGYSLPKWGVDGLFGPETKRATENFEKDYKLDVNGLLDQNDLKYLTASLIENEFEESDLSAIQKEKENTLS